MTDAVLTGWLAPALQERREACQYRTRRVLKGKSRTRLHDAARTLTGFCSNDYLGLASDPRVMDALCEGVRRYGTGSGASAVVSGQSGAHEALESALASWTGRSRALLFPSGFQANLAVHDALLRPQDRVFGDRLNHASLLDGARLAGARMTRYRHGDATALSQQLTRYKGTGRKLVVTDGVFSMDGDQAPLQAISTLCKAHDAVLFVDDAHGVGVLGEHGGGVLDTMQLTQTDVPILMGTLSKALGLEGAFVAGSEALIDSLIQFARPYIYTTALPSAIAHAGLTALNIVRTAPERRARLHENIRFFRTLAHQAALPLMDSDTPIQPIVLGSAQRVMAVAAKLEAEGLLVGAIRPPTVPKGSARLRVTLSAVHEQHEIEALVAALARHLHGYERVSLPS